MERRREEDTAIAIRLSQEKFEKLKKKVKGTSYGKGVVVSVSPTGALYLVKYPNGSAEWVSRKKVDKKL